MAINKNHEFEDLDGVKCAVVEKNISKERVDFLKPLLELNGYTVVVVTSPPPKAAVPAAPVAESAAPTPPAPETFTLGVSDVMFNAINAVFGRLLKTRDGHIVTLAYWRQQETISHDQIPYYENT
jgi:hypothetical protein